MIRNYFFIEYKFLRSIFTFIDLNSGEFARENITSVFLIASDFK